MKTDTNINLFSIIDKAEVEKRIAGLDIKFIYLQKTKETEYEELVKELAIKDHFARRAARDKFFKKNIRYHDA